MAIYMRIHFIKVVFTHDNDMAILQGIRKPGLVRRDDWNTSRVEEISILRFEMDRGFVLGIIRQRWRDCIRYN